MNEFDPLNLPPLPDSAVYCLKALYKGGINYDIVAQKITNEKNTAQAILTLANSQAYEYETGHHTTDLKQAIIRIGILNVTKILCEEYYKLLFSPAKKFKIGFLTLENYNRHANCVSNLAVEFAEILKIEDVINLRLAGLFHDIGLLGRIFLDSKCMEQILEKCTQEEIDIDTAEDELGVISHDIIGARIAKHWMLPDEVITMIEYFHSRNEIIKSNATKLEHLIDILSISDLIAHKAHHGFDNYRKDTRINVQFIQKIGLTKDLVLEKISQLSKI